MLLKTVTYIIIIISIFHAVLTEDHHVMMQDVQRIAHWQMYENVTQDQEDYLHVRSKRQMGRRRSCRSSCGVAPSMNTGAVNLIINGQRVQPTNKYPWMVALKDGRNEVFCGGAILNEWYILSAGHCIKFVRAEEIKVAFSVRGSLTQGTPIQRVIFHPKYTGGIAHDIGLIQMRYPIICNEMTSPVCLPPYGLELRPDSRTGYVIAGWGQMANRRQSQELLEGHVRIVPMYECNVFDSNDPFRGTSYCCMAYQSTGPCFGDSGGSMFARYGNRFFSVGITSVHLSDSCDLSAPFIYVSVAKHMDWIYYVTGIMPHRIY